MALHRGGVRESGRLVGELNVTDPAEFKIRRAVKTGVILNKETALSFYDWMRERLQEMGVEDDDL